MLRTWSLSQSWEASTSLFQNFVKSSRHPLVPPYSMGRISVEFVNCGKSYPYKKWYQAPHNDDKDLKKWRTGYKREIYTFAKIVHQATVVTLSWSKSFGFKTASSLQWNHFLSLFTKDIGSDAYLGVKHLASLHLLRLESFHQVYHCVHNTRPKKVAKSIRIN